MSHRWRAKPITIDAFRLGSPNPPDWFHEGVTAGKIQLMSNYCIIRTQHSTMEAVQGVHWIIRDVEGQFHPCTEDVFSQMFEAVDDTNSQSKPNEKPINMNEVSKNYNLRGQELHTIGWAVKQLHNNLAVRRVGWGARNLYLSLQVPDQHSKMSLPYVYIHTADNNLIPWSCTQADLLAIDWELAA